MTNGLQRTFSVLAFAFCLVGLEASAAFAWTFDEDECSPITESDLSRQTPNIFLMVDHSGSMNEAVGDRVCHVCNNGTNFKVDGVAECVTEAGWTRSGRMLPGLRDTGNGYSYSTTITLNDDERGDAKLDVSAFGNFADSCSGATILVDGNRVGTIEPGRRGGPDCGSSRGLTGTFDIPASALRDGEVTITVDTYDSYRTLRGECPGVDRCLTRGDDITWFKLYRPGTTYEGFIEDAVCGYETKWEQAYFGLKALVEDSDAADPEYARFGYGTFETGTQRELTCGRSNGNDIVRELEGRTSECCGRDGCDADTYCVTDSGSTAIADAINTSYGSSCFEETSPPTPAAVILLTDGNPTVRVGSGGCSRGDSDCYELAALDSVEAACDNRSTSPMYMVGLGSGTDEELNDMISAASGTGVCLDGGAEVDPCDYVAGWKSTGSTWRSGVSMACEGSFQVDDRDQLLDALQEITAKLACTFSVDFLRSNRVSVPEDATYDYDYLAVQLYEDGSPASIYHELSSHASPADEGWHFTSSDRKFVEFSSYYCGRIATGAYSKGTTQLACLCQEDTGTRCDVPDYDELRVCPEGNWICIEGTDICEPDANCCTPGEPCDTGLPGVCGPGTRICDGGLGTCVPNEEPSEEICDLLDNDCDGRTDEGLNGHECTIPGAVGRCGIGTSRCTAGNTYCDALGAQPELCNGLDDDCDGMIDNMVVSWGKPEYSAMKPGLSDDGEAAACNFNDVCACPNGPAPTSTEANFTDYLADWSPVCLCGEGLGPAERSAPVETQDRAVPRGGCATANSAGEGMLSLLAVGFLALGRRRR